MIGSGKGVGRAQSSLVVPCKRGGTAEWGRPAPTAPMRISVLSFFSTLLLYLQSLFHPLTLSLFSKKTSFIDRYTVAAKLGGGTLQTKKVISRCLGNTLNPK